MIFIDQPAVSIVSRNCRSSLEFSTFFVVEIAIFLDDPWGFHHFPFLGIV